MIGLQFCRISGSNSKFYVLLVYVLFACVGQISQFWYFENSDIINVENTFSFEILETFRASGGIDFGIYFRRST
jgi:hypothetical protein